MQIDPAQHTHADNYKLLTNPVVPRPIAWFTSQNANGVINLAPFSFFNEVSGNPLYLIISIGLNDAGEAKDTAKNIMASGEFVVNLVTGELSDAMNIPAADFPGVQVAQFAIAGQQYAGDRRGGDVPCGRSCRMTGRFDVARISYVEWKKGRTGSISKTNLSGGAMAEFDDAGYGRNYPRENLRTNAEIMIDEQWHDCVIVNMSPSGARLQIELDVSRGKDVVIKIDAFGRFNATVAWCRDNEIGVKFDHDPSEMTRVLIELESRG